MTETAFSAVKPWFGPVTYPRAWGSELPLTAAVHELDRSLEQ